MNEPDTPLTLATCVERSLHLSLDGFDEHQARLYGVSVVDEEAARSQEDGALRITFLAEHGDVYELLDAPTSSVVRMFDGAAVLTSGWAAPINDEGSDVPSVDVCVSWSWCVMKAWPRYSGLPILPTT